MKCSGLAVSVQCFNDPFDCTAEGGLADLPLVMWVDLIPSGAGRCSNSRLVVLNATTGAFEQTLCRFPNLPADQCLNSCGINPADSSIYCVAGLNNRAAESNFARITCPLTGNDTFVPEGKICWLGSFPSVTSRAGDFNTRNDNFVFQATGLFQMPSIADFPGYTTQPPFNLVPNSTQVGSLNWQPEDLVVVNQLLGCWVKVHG
ncbi:hypothetical protein AK812_SmicGene16056 [Symbiodinium microadriaticum]|uniref:Uncharacterized protein n=1 Tax=Symbiodinium microadriaticum TaxID=2951 RepID=A0A1Q9E197_SYMMI|nr:hypothetical protein AK812_SmicGene16056 [Symbiodinium microadriaticum]